VPIFYYFATFNESIAALRDLCDQGGFRVIPGRTFDKPVAPEYEQVTDELVHLLREGPGFYLSGSFAKLPVHIKRLDQGPAEGRYMVDALTEGPVLQGLIARDNLVDGVPTLLLGNLTHQKQYRAPGTGEWAPASAELKAAYKRAVSIIKKHLVKHESANYPIGREALRLVEDGKARLKKDFL
jgi:hypothetical protein